MCTARAHPLTYCGNSGEENTRIQVSAQYSLPSSDCFKHSDNACIKRTRGHRPEDEPSGGALGRIRSGPVSHSLNGAGRKRTLAWGWIDGHYSGILLQPSHTAVSCCQVFPLNRGATSPRPSKVATETQRSNLGAEIELHRPPAAPAKTCKARIKTGNRCC